MTGISYLRQRGVLSAEKLHRITATIIGAGGIGSPTALTIAKMGIPRIGIWDDDRVEPHNLPNQMYRLKDVGRSKSEALSDLIREYVSARITPVVARYGSGSPQLNGVVISAVHTMAARKEIWSVIKESPKVSLYIEARMGLEALWIHTLVAPFTSEAVRRYESTLYDDENTVEAACTERAIIYTVMNAAGWIANQVKRFIHGDEIRREIIVDLNNQMVLVE